MVRTRRAGHERLSQAGNCVDHEPVATVRDRTDREADPRHPRVDHPLDDQGHHRTALARPLVPRLAISAGSRVVRGLQTGLDRIGERACALDVEHRLVLSRERRLHPVLSDRRGAHGEPARPEALTQRPGATLPLGDVGGRVETDDGHRLRHPESHHRQPGEPLRLAPDGRTGERIELEELEGGRQRASERGRGEGRREYAPTGEPFEARSLYRRLSSA